MAKNNSIYKWIDRIVWGAALVASSIFMFVLVYRQASEGEIYHSDIGPYIDEMLGVQTEYSFPYPIMFKTAALINHFLWPGLAMAIAVTGFNILALIITRVLLNRHLQMGIMATFSTVALFFCSMIYNDMFVGLGIPNRYVGVFTPNPWHNATYMSARPFMMLAFVYGAYTLLHYEQDFEVNEKFSIGRYRNYLLFAFFMLAVTMTKPAYTLPHMVVVGIVAIYRLLKSKMGIVRQTTFLAITYIPTICALLYQYVGVFSGVSVEGEEHGVGICLGTVWLNYVSNIPLAILLAAGFPIIVLVFHIKQLHDSEQFRFGWQIYAAGLLMAFFLYEKGFRIKHFNFAWGYICGLFVVFFVSLEEWCKDIKYLINKDTKGWLKVSLESFVLILHLICGICYFVSLWNGGDYY